MMRKHQLRSPAWSNSTGSAAWWTLGKSLKMPNETHISWQQNRSAPVILSIHCWCNCQDCLGPYLHGCADNIQQSCMHFERENSKREAIWNKCMRYIYDHLWKIQEESNWQQSSSWQATHRARLEAHYARVGGSISQSWQWCAVRQSMHSQAHRISFDIIVWKKHEINDFFSGVPGQPRPRNLFSRCPPQTLHGR